MSWNVRDSLGERPLARDAFPVSLGGAGSSILLAGAAPGALAWLGLHEDQLFLQPEGAAKLLHNGAEVRQSVWLHTGDVISVGSATVRVLLEHGVRTLVVDDGTAGNATLPPTQATATVSGGATGADAERIAAISYRAGRQQAAEERKRVRVGPWLWSIAGAIALGLVWFFSTAVTVQLAVEPADSAVQVSGGGWPLQLGGQLFLREGRYQVKLSAPGYRGESVPLVVSDAAGQRLERKLVRLPGRVRVELPGNGMLNAGDLANVQVPAVVELPAGKQSVSITVPRFLPWKGELDVRGKGEEQSLKPTLVPDWAPVTVSTEPAGARLRIDGKDQGVTPARVELAAGAHKLELRLGGFRPWESDLLVKANQPETVGPVRLGLPDGTLALTSTPVGARASVGGVFRGVTPLRIALRPGVAATVGLEAPGYESAEQRVTVAAGATQSLQLDLRPILGQIEVTANYPDADVYVDGQKVGHVGATYSLPSTEHQLEVRRGGYETFATRVTPRPALAQKVHAELQTADQAKLARIPAQIRARGFIELKLMPSGEFVMGSSRREPGRRANEAQREVVLKRHFYVGTHEVTNAQFREFRAEHKSGLFANTTLNLENQPVVNVSWQEAAEFCNWLSARDGLPPAYQTQSGELVAVAPMNTGYRLPTEAEWEYVARYRNGGASLRYPWGDELPVAPHSGNYADQSARVPLQDVLADYDDGFVSSAPVGSFPPTALGLYDIGGNVSEWTTDLYAASFNANDRQTDPLSAGAGALHVVRGASWRTSQIADLRLAARGSEGAQRDDLGFRIARYAE